MASGNSDDEEEFKRSKKNFRPPSNLSGSQDAGDIFDRPEGPKVVDSFGRADPDDDGDEIKLTINKRKRRRKKKVILKDEDDDLPGETEQKKAEEEEETSKITVEDEEEKGPVKKLQSPPKSKSSKKIEQVAEANIDEEEDNQQFEGGDSDDDKIKAFDTGADDNIGTTNPIQDTDFDDTLKTKKRKKKIIKKKKKKPLNDTSLNDTGTPALLAPDAIYLPAETKSKIDPLESKPDDDEISRNSKTPNSDREDLDRLASLQMKDKLNKREYSSKFFKKSIKYGYRISNLVHSYDDKFPRVWRLLILYMQVFYMFWITGMVLYGSGHTTEVNNLTGYYMFGVAIMLVGLERLIHMGVIMILVNLKKRQPKLVKQNETEDEEEIDMRASRLSLNHTSDMNATGVGFNKTEANIFDRPGAENNAENRPVLVNSENEKENDQLGFLLLVGVTVCVILFLWIWIIIMSVRYSTRAGFLWAICFGWHTIITFIFFEPFYVM
jgi:hypothetical protein